MTDLNSGSFVLFDDDELIARARGGDREAAGELLDHCREPVARFCYRYLGNLAEAEDAAQDVLTRLSSGGRWPEGSFRAWVYRVARNRCLDLLKRRKDGRVGAGTAVSDSRVASPRTGPRTALLREERYERLRHLIETLPEAHREVLMLRYFDDLSRREIAQVLELPESVVKSRLFESRRRLKQLTEESYG